MRDLIQLVEKHNSAKLYMVTRLTKFTSCLEITELQDDYEFPVMTNFKIKNYIKE